MAASKSAAVCASGYPNDRFQQIVSQTLHCIICTDIFKDPVMCPRNEHLFCKACITRHLMYSQTCPTCMEPLTVDTLSQAPRSIRNLLAELEIRCEFFERGCGKFVRLDNLERHVADCGFAPGVCPNEGCQLELNKQDLLLHATVECEHRRVHCHSCNDVKRMMNTMKINLAAVSEKLTKVEKNVVTVYEKLDRNEAKSDKNEEKFENLTVVAQNLVALGNLVQQQLNKQQESNRRLEADSEEMKKSLSEITKQLEKMTQQDQFGHQRKAIAEADEVKRDAKLIIAGGFDGHKLNSVEMFSLLKETWTLAQPMKERRQELSSVVYNNHVFVLGGDCKSVEKLSLNAIHDGLSLPWERFPAELSGRLVGHSSVVYNGRLIVIGGYDSGKDAYSDSVTEISLVPPYTSKLLATMPQARCYHGVAIFGDKIFMLGGRRRAVIGSILGSVVMYDITRNEWQELAPLPYPLLDMATVKWGDDNFMIVGGTDGSSRPLSKVLMYNIKTQKIQSLPDMKYKRKGCVAVVVRDNLIVMGGYDGRSVLKSVEHFRFDRCSWEKLPDMHHGREWATAVAF